MKFDLLKRYSQSLAIAIAILCIGFTWLAYKGAQSLFGNPEPFQILSSGPTIEKLEKLSHLVTQKVNVAEILTAKEDNYKGSWIIKGDALIGVDMSKCKIVQKDEASRYTKILLPLPYVIHPRVDHQRTVTWSVDKGDGFAYWKATMGFGDPGKIRDSAMKHAQELVEYSAKLSDGIVESKRQTETILRGFYSELGWKVDIEWSKE